MLKVLRRLLVPVKARYIIDAGHSRYVCAADQLLLDSALRAGVDIGYSCQVGACGTCRVRVLSGTYTTERDLSYVLSPEELATNVTLACQTWPTSDIRLEAVDNAMFTWATVVSCRALDEKVVELRLEPDEALEYEAGQSVYLAPEELREPRAFSMVDLGTEQPGQLVFHVKLRAGGAFSGWLRRHVGLNGARLRVSHPLGRSALETATACEHLVCIAGGSGMGVVASLAQRRHRTSPLQRVTLIAINRAELSPYHVYVARALEAMLGWAPTLINVPYSDWCDPGIPTPVLAVAANSLAVSCGSEAVLVAAKRHLAHWGIPQTRSCSVSFTASGTRQGELCGVTADQGPTYANA